MPKRTGLGRGLDALIPGGFQSDSSSDGQSMASDGLNLIPIDQIVPNPRQPRSRFDETALQELTASIKEHGVIQPLIVSRNQDDNNYTLIAGERRWQASRRAGLLTVPVIVRQTTDQEKLEIALIENIQRADLNALEEASAYRQLAYDFQLSHEEIASRVGKSRVTVTNTLRLLNLPVSIQKALMDGEISEGHARAILGLTNPRAMESALQTVTSQKMTVRQTEDLVNRLKGEKPAVKIKGSRMPDEVTLEEYIRSNIGQKISIKIGKDKSSGSMTLFYGSEEEFQDLMIRLTGKKYSP